MASNIEFVEFICYQLQELGHIRFRKMFGDYMVNPIFCICYMSNFAIFLIKFFP